MSLDDTPANGVVVAETGLGRLQLVAKAPTSAFLIDEPTSVGGLSSGPTPYDLLCASLAACTAMTLRLYVERKALTVGRIRVGVVHTRPSLEAKDLFVRTISVDGPVDEALAARLLQIAERCPVHRTLDRGSDVSTCLKAGGEAEVQPSLSLGQHVQNMEEAAAV